MKPTQPSVLRLIRHSALGGLAMLFAAVAVLTWSYSRYSADNREQLEHVHKERVAKRRLFSLIEELAAIQLARDNYLKLREHGVLGDLNKTRLLDQVEAALLPFGEAVLDYKLDSYKQFTKPVLSELTRHQFGMHQLLLNFKPVDELEFIDIWQALAASSPGVSPVESCELFRKDLGTESAGKIESPSNGTTATPIGMARLEARCVLTSYSIRLQTEQQPLTGTNASLNAPPASAHTMAPVRVKNPESR